jgi:hypothetical protein
MPKIWNMRDPKKPKNAVYIGRPSMWGNPWSHLPGKGQYQVGTRVEAVLAYEKWIRNQPNLIETLRKDYKGLDLVCWCAPQLCHGEVLLEIANEERN